MWIKKKEKYYLIFLAKICNFAKKAFYHLELVESLDFEFNVCWLITCYECRYINYLPEPLYFVLT